MDAPHRVDSPAASAASPRLRSTGFGGRVWPLLALVCLASGCSRETPPRFQGYLEADYVFVGAPVPGILVERPVQRGASVTKGSRLFVLESTAESATLAEAESRLAQSQARLDNLRKGRRPSEIASLEARLTQATASRDLSESEFLRREQLYRQNVLSTAELDLARSRRDADRAFVAALSSELETARLGARDDEIRAAENDVTAARAGVQRARWTVEQKVQTAPVDALVHETLFEPGEFVGTGMPVVALLPPANLKIRFFVPQSELSRAQPGSRVQVLIDGQASPKIGIVETTATRPEFTPPVIFSRESRQKLVFRVEARVDGPPDPALRPGQPVDVLWESGSGTR